jgi:hypothetical protein
MAASNCLLPGNAAPDFSAVAVTEDGTATRLFSLSNLATDYVVLVFFPNVADVSDLLALRQNLDKFREVRLSHPSSLRLWINFFRPSQHICTIFVHTGVFNTLNLSVIV